MTGDPSGVESTNRLQSLTVAYVSILTYYWKRQSFSLAVFFAVYREIQNGRGSPYFPHEYLWDVGLTDGFDFSFLNVGIDILRKQIKKGVSLFLLRP